MTIYKKILSLVMTAVLLFTVLPMNAVAQEDDFPEVLAEAKKGVAQIYGLGDDGKTLSGWVGTGFAVGEEGEDSDVFLTNWHVVTGNGEYSLDEVRIWILQEGCTINDQTGEPEALRSVTCEVLKTTTGHPDYAIIRATESIEGYKALPLLSSEEVQDGAKVYALGYPAVVGSASASHYGIDDITSTNGIVSQHMQYALEGDTWVLMHTAQISGGNSGGPLITEDGAVVGLNTYGFGESQGNMNRYCAVYIDYAIEGLDELDIRYDLFEPKSVDLVTIVIAGAVVLVVAVVVLIILQNKKKKEEEARRRMEAQRRREAEQRRQEEERRRQEEQRRRQEEQRRREQAVKANLRLNGGTAYPVRAAGGIIGREKDCMIVLPENAPGVSRNHCKLEFRGDQLVLTDLNSTYGTFIHGKRVPPNTPVALKPGSSFSLGSDKITFTVC